MSHLRRRDHLSKVVTLINVNLGRIQMSVQEVASITYSVRFPGAAETFFSNQWKLWSWERCRDTQRICLSRAGPMTSRGPGVSSQCPGSAYWMLRNLLCLQSLWSWSLPPRTMRCTRVWESTFKDVPQSWKKLEVVSISPGPLINLFITRTSRLESKLLGCLLLRNFKHWFRQISLKGINHANDVAW